MQFDAINARQAAHQSVQIAAASSGDGAYQAPFT
jgi:hypothetical protein